MMRPLSLVIAGVGVALLVSACATKEYVKEQVGTSETRVTALVNATENLLTSRAETQERTLRETERELRETVNRIGLTRRAVDQVGTLAVDAKARADAVDVTARDAETRLAHRLATRNNFRLLDTKVVYFESGQAEIRRDAIPELDEIATALKSDANAILELQSFADPRGSDRVNNELARDRVDVVMRYLVQRHGVEVRQLNAVAMGKEELAPGEKMTDERLRRSRRVEMRLLTPWSSAEDKQTRSAPQETQSAQSGASDDEGGSASPATMGSPATGGSPAPTRSPTTTADRDRAAVDPADVVDPMRQEAPWRDIIRSITRQELGARD